jgi:hypothetical protein
MPGTTLTLCFPDQAALEQEYVANLQHARAYVPGARGYELFAPCTLLLRLSGDGRELAVDCCVVMVREEEPQAGVAVQFMDRSQSTLAALASFVQSMPAANDVDELDGEPGDEREGDELDDWTENAASEADVVEARDPSADGRSRPPLSLSQERQQRLRNLTPAERIKVAQGPVLDDRVLLERIYGNAVWELLLRNAKITVPEVARIARKGTVPRPLLELIVENEHWIRQSVIRRALLSNPRLSGDSATKVLRTMSARELKLVPQQTAYPAIVRQAAQRLMRG